MPADGGRAAREAIEAAARALPRDLDDGAGAFVATFVRRPVLAIVLNLLVVVAGLAALYGAEVRELPDVDQPVVTITTVYSGASPATIDAEVTELVEGAASRLPGVTGISSSSRFGRSQVTVSFADSVDLDVAASDLRDAIARIRGTLPAGIEEPRVVKADANANEAIRVALTSDSVSIVELTRMAQNEVMDALSAVDGVADVQLRGERQPVLYVDVDQVALASRGLDIGDIARVVATVAGETPAGTLTSATQDLVVRARAGLSTPEDFAALALDRTTRLGDVARVYWGPDTGLSVTRTNQRSGIGLGIIRQAGSNTLDISRDVRRAVEDLRRILPPEVDIRVVTDEAVFVRGSIREVLLALAQAMAIVIAVILAFLGSARATLIPAATMPVALIGTLGAIWLAGFSVNILTLLALVLATGMVVDDAIVVLENVMRRRAYGLAPRAAALVGTREVFFAVVSTTATLAAVFVPISFLPGQVGGLFREFGYTLAIAVAISCAVTLTLTPMLSARVLPLPVPGPEPRRRGLPGRAAELLADLLQGLFARLLRAALAAPLVVVSLAGLFAVAAALLFQTLPREVTPREDRGFVLLSVVAPQGVSLAYTDAQLRRIEAILAQYRENGEAEGTFVAAGFGGANSGFVVLPLVPWEARARSQDEITAEIVRKVGAIPGIRAFPILSNSLGIRGGGRGLQFAIVGGPFERNLAAANLLVARMSEDPRFGGVRLSVEFNQPQITVAVDRERADDLGIDVNGLARAVQSVLDGRDIGTLFLEEGSSPIRLVSAGTRIDDPSDLENILLRSGSGQMLPMSSIASLTESAAPASLQRESKLRAVSITASLAADFPMQAAWAEAERIAAEILPPGARLLPLAEAASLGETSRGLAVTFAVAIVVVLLVLAAQFESFIAAVIILLTVPMGLACAVFAMALTGGSLNVYSQIGLVLLVGVMAKNGILIVEFANQLRERGLGLRDAIEQASIIRLRPVAMTAISTVLGGLPLVLASGPGAEARSALGWVVVGGLGFATLATLFLTPVCYLALARFTRPRREEAERLARELEAARAATRSPEPAPAAARVAGGAASP